MLLSLIAALALTQAQPPGLDELRLLASQVALGQACEAAELTTVQFEVLAPHAETLTQRAESEGLDKGAINDSQEQGYATMMAHLEAQYSEGRDDPDFPTLIKDCETLNQEHPTFFTAFVAED